MVSVEQALCGEVWLGERWMIWQEAQLTLVLWRGSVSSGCASALQVTHILTKLPIHFEFPPSHEDKDYEGVVEGKSWYIWVAYKLPPTDE